MKATELMIGDWVLDNRVNVPLRVNLFISQLEVPEWSPIPLTPEILEKNGFVKTNFDGYFRKRFRHLCGYHYICIELKNNTIIIGEMYCPPEDCEECQWENEMYLPTGNICIHQLQHALRLCGLNELADNFIVE